MYVEDILQCVRRIIYWHHPHNQVFIVLLFENNFDLFIKLKKKNNGMAPGFIISDSKDEN